MTYSPFIGLVNQFKTLLLGWKIPINLNSENQLNDLHLWRTEGLNILLINS